MDREYTCIGCEKLLEHRRDVFISYCPSSMRHFTRCLTCFERRFLDDRLVVHNSESMTMGEFRRYWKIRH